MNIFWLHTRSTTDDKNKLVASKTPVRSKGRLNAFELDEKLKTPS
jgi:hypothetical protein